MAGNDDLDRLKASQDLAFQRKQDAYRQQDQAWKRRVQAKEEHDRAYEEKQRAHAVQDAAWHDLQRVRENNGPRIDRLNALQETAYQNMTRAFESASAAFDRRDGATAKSYSNDGHRYKAESQGYVVERRRLVDEIKEAKARHAATQPAFQRARAAFEQARHQHDRAKAEHAAARDAFKNAQMEFDRANAALKQALESVRARSRKRKEDNRALAARAGVPFQYLDALWVSRQNDGTVNIYFGGVGTPNGPGHGHYVLGFSGEVTYRRDPFDAHGAHNFTESQREYADMIPAEAASGEFGFLCRFRGYDAYVESGWDRANKRKKINVYYGPNGPFGPGHHHAVAYPEAPLTFVSDRIDD